MTRAEQLTEKAERLARIQEAGHPDGFLWNACNCIFPTWPEEIAWMEEQGYELARPEQYIAYGEEWSIPRGGQDDRHVSRFCGPHGSVAARYGYPIFRQKAPQQ